MKLQMPGEAERSKRRRVIHLTPGYLTSRSVFISACVCAGQRIEVGGNEREKIQQSLHAHRLLFTFCGVGRNKIFSSAALQDYGENSVVKSPGAFLHFWSACQFQLGEK
jgi:hypothetical protein